VNNKLKTLDFATFFLRKIRVISIIVGLLIAITAPSIFLVLDLQDGQRLYQRYSEQFASRVQIAINENPEYWQLNVEKFIEVSSGMSSNGDIRTIEVYDSDMRLLHFKKIKDEGLITLPGETPILFNNKPVGNVIVIGGPGRTLAKFGGLLLVFSLLGVLVGFYLYKCSALNAKQYEQEVKRLFGKIFIKNQKLRLLNLEMESETAERKQIVCNLIISEESLMERNIQLAIAIEDIKLAQSTLIQQEKMAGIGQLAAGMAHEINNPLGFITGNIEALEQYFTAFSSVLTQYRELGSSIRVADDPQIANKVNHVVLFEKEQDLDYILADLPDLFRDTNEGLKRMSKIVKGVSIFSRTNKERIFELYDLNQLVRNTLLVADNEIKHYATVDERFGEIPVIETIGGEINQVLLNLVVNAVQAIKEKDSEKMGMIQISTWYDNKFVYCAIEDSGIGVSVQNINNIFNPFFTTKPAGQGTGIGLSISYDIIVNRHHGEIIVDSNYGEGAKFTIKLPLKQHSSQESKDEGVFTVVTESCT